MRISGLAVTTVNLRAWTGSAWVNLPLTLGGVPINLRGWDGSAWQPLVVDPSGHLLENIGGLSNLAVNHVSMTAAAAQIIAANTSRKSLCVKNIGTNDVALGPSGVTFATGFILKAGEALSDIRTTAAIHGICDTGLTSTVCYWEE